MKIVLTMLLRKYRFELPGGPETEFGTNMTVVTRPTLKGEVGCSIPMRVSKVEP
jgi:hypothetical protein